MSSLPRNLLGDLLYLIIALLAAASLSRAQTSGGTHLEQGDPAIRYTGDWYTNTSSLHSSGVSALTNIKDAQATVTFTGTGITWIGHSDGWSGIAWVYLDGALTTVDTYTPTDQYQRPIYSVRGLPAGSHNLTIQVPHERGPNTQGSWVWIDAFDIENGSGVSGGVSATSGRSEQSSAAITYAGIWNSHVSSVHSGGTASLAINPGSLATIIFRGTGITWLGYRDEYSGIAKVSVDGVPRANVDTYRSPAQPEVPMFNSGVLPAGTHTLTIEVTGTHSTASGGSWIWLDAFDVVGDGGTGGTGGSGGPAPPAINSGGIVNAARLSGAASAGSIVSLFGSGFAAAPAWAGSLPLPTTLGTTTVRVNGISAPLFYVSPAQINFQLPWQLGGQSTASVTVTTGAASSAAVSLTLPALAPGIFTANSSGAGQGSVVIEGTSSLAAPEGSITGARPVDRGGFVAIYCTGLGAVSSQPGAGVVATAEPPSFAATKPAVTIGSVSAPVTFAGLAPGFVGLYQVNVQVPQQVPPGSQVPVVLTVGGVTSNTVTIAVR